MSTSLIEFDKQNTALTLTQANANQDSENLTQQKRENLEISGAKQSPESLSELLDHLVEQTSDEDDGVTLGDLLDTLDNRSFGPLLLVPSLIALSPLGAIPGMSLITGTIIILFCSQILVGLNHPWLPKKLLEISFSHKKLKNAVKKMKPWTKRFDKLLKHRLTFLTTFPSPFIVAVISIALAMLFYPLALLPFAVAIPSSAIVLFALGLTARDGLLIIIGYVMTFGTSYLAYTQWPF